MLSLELKGTPLERGIQHGKAFKKKIAELVEKRRALFLTYFPPHSEEKIKSLIHDQFEVLRKHPALYEEMKGIALGSELTEEDILILNNYTDMRDFGYSKGTHDDGGCSVFSIHRPDGKVLCGQTWDMDASAHPYILRLTIHPSAPGEKKQEILTITGCVGLCGVNSNSVSVFINNLHCSETGKGLVWPALVRELLNQDSASQAVQYFQKNLPSSGHNYLICDAKESYNLECTGKRVDITQHQTSAGANFHTNHYLGKLKEIEITKRVSLTTEKRIQALQQLFQNYDYSNAEYQTVATDIMSGKTGDVISIPISDHVEDTFAVTCGGIFLDLNAKKGEIFHGVYDDNDRTWIKW